jgi:hypothetical protein
MKILVFGVGVIGGRSGRVMVVPTRYLASGAQGIA